MITLPAIIIVKKTIIIHIQILSKISDIFILFIPYTALKPPSFLSKRRSFGLMKIYRPRRYYGFYPDRISSYGHSRINPWLFPHQPPPLFLLRNHKNGMLPTNNLQNLQNKFLCRANTYWLL